MDTDPFLQADGETLKNRLGIEADPEALKHAERELSSDRLVTLHEAVSGNFDADHLRDIHRHLFQDVYEWAGTMRSDQIALEGEQVNVPAAVPEMSKGSTTFMPSAYVERGLAEVERLSNSDAARSSDPAEFSDAAGEVLSALNHVHPFREGNGRTQRAFIEQLAERAGHNLDFEGITGERMIEASVEASGGNDDPLKRIIAESLDPARVDLRQSAIRALEQTGVDANEFWVETPAPGDQVQGTLLNRHDDHLSIVTEENRFLALPPSALPDAAKPGHDVDFHYHGAEHGPSRDPASALDSLQDTARQTWADIQAIDPGPERVQLEREFADMLRSLPAELRAEIVPERTARHDRSRDDDLEL